MKKLLPGEETFNQLKSDGLEERSSIFNKDLVSPDDQDSEELLTENSIEALSGLSKESMNDDLNIDSLSSFNPLVEQKELHSDEESAREIEKISEPIQVNEEEKEEEIKEQGEKKSRFGWFKKKK